MATRGLEMEQVWDLVENSTFEELDHIISYLYEDNQHTKYWYSILNKGGSRSKFATQFFYAQIIGLYKEQNGK